MMSKNKRTSAAERRHLAAVKSLPCSLCDTQGISEAHHIKQSSAWTCVALCDDCHRGPLGIHGDKTLLRIHKLDELDLLAVTIGRLLGA